MEFFRPISQCVTTEIGAGVAASKDVISKKRGGRHAVAITAKADLMVCGSADDTDGIKVKADETMVFPVTSDRSDQLYITGDATITEFF